MTFDKILDNNTLGSVRYDNDSDNALQQLFSQWHDVEWLYEFFDKNKNDLENYFKITDLNKAIFDTIDDSDRLQCLILDLSPERQHTLLELNKMENVRNLLISEGAIDADCFTEYLSEL